MGYIRAENVLPQELIETIQQYVDGKLIYIPCKEKQEWGTTTSAKVFFRERIKYSITSQIIKKTIKSFSLMVKYMMPSVYSQIL